ncbi:hypothetical protein C8F04DRAFT_1104164 [Mycena alexandri]|uniref:F-box domain-containing protein n=1 Tax=Mycena alexandri TaxID=1745969 RepID=A0AAD6X2Q9_9AGAR|nr:hypothetical protein C8F04DRAFT_1104164 [Mycena alexandri]
MSEVIPPIRHVPAEVLCDIFLLTLPHTRLVGGKSMPIAPWRLALVCRHWRECALVYAALWSSINIDGTVLDTLSSSYATLILEHYPLAALETQILRWPVYTADASHLDTLLELVVRESDRWITARIDGDNVENKWFRSLAPIRGRINRLEKLEFLTTGHNECDLFAVAPRLRGMALTDHSYRIVSLHVVVPWSQLTHLRASWKIETLMEVIRATPNLVSCGLKLWMFYDPLHTPVRITILSKLRTLYVGDDQLFNFLEAPDLRHLFVGGSGFLTVQNPQAAVFIPLLDTLPTLRTLHVSFQPWNSTVDWQRFIAAMTVIESHPVRCPNLVSLRFGWDARGDYTTVLAMVESRWHGTGSFTLWSVRIVDFGGNLDAGTVPARFQELREDGLDVVVMNGYSGDVLLCTEDPDIIPP